jgi:hypothetical protein
MEQAKDSDEIGHPRSADNTTCAKLLITAALKTWCSEQQNTSTRTAALSSLQRVGVEILANHTIHNTSLSNQWRQQ